MFVDEFVKRFALCVSLLSVLSFHARAEDQEVQGATAQQDEIVLRNGSRILGKVTGARDGEVKVETDFAGEIVIAVDQILSMHTSEPQVILLADDSVVENDSLRIEENEFVVAPGTPEMQSYALDDLLVVNPEPWEMGQGYQWTGVVSFAFAIERGNSDTDELDYKLETVWRSKRDRYTLKLSGEIDEANDQKNADNWNVIGKYDYFISDQTYWGINAFAESDDFADLDLRWAIGPYIGREFYTDPIFTLSAEVGASWVEEDFITAPDQEYPAANWALNMSSNYLGGDSKLYFDQIGFWNMDETSDVIVNTSIGLAFPLLWNLEAAAEVLLEYDSGAVEGVDDLDETYKFRIGYSW